MHACIGLALKSEVSGFDMQYSSLKARVAFNITNNTQSPNATVGALPDALACYSESAAKGSQGYNYHNYLCYLGFKKGLFGNWLHILIFLPY